MSASTRVQALMAPTRLWFEYRPVSPISEVALRPIGETTAGSRYKSWGPE